MRALALDHFFGQDIAALRAALAPDEHLRTFHYSVLRGEALRVFPPSVAVGLEGMSTPAFAAGRERYATRLQRLMDDEFAAGPFDVVVLPSDLFFYVRDLPAACERLGVPVVVVQKETTLSPATVERLAGSIARHAPFQSTAMTVCSERQRSFWLRAGAPPGRLTVTGQPRFDVYGTPLPVRPAGRAPRVLFFSYLLHAYHPSGASGTRGAPAWERLHRQTEEGLRALAREGWDVVVKPHPQQDFIPADSGLHVAPAGADARELIRDADVVVGFQTTALIESLAAGRPVVYTGWDPEARRLASDLIPFHEWGDVLAVVGRADDLPDVVRRARAADAGRSERARAIVEEYLGPIDAGAARRALDVVRRYADAAAAHRSPAVESRREQLVGRGRSLRHARRGLRSARLLATAAFDHRVRGRDGQRVT
jgi:hypothetical protein